MIDAAVAAWRVEYEARRSVERPKEAEWKRRERARKRQAGQAPNGAMSGDDGRVSRQDTPDEIALGRYLLTAAQSNIAGDNDVSPILDLL